MPDLTTEPRKPYDEKPLPVGIARPPKGFVYVGIGVSGLESYAYLPASGVWKKAENRMRSCGISDYHYAAPAELCNRLPSSPDAGAGHVKLTEPKPVEPVKGRFDVARGPICVASFNTADQAYDRAEQIARDNPKEIVYVYQLRALFTASVNVNRTDY